MKNQLSSLIEDTRETLDIAASSVLSDPLDNNLNENPDDILNFVKTQLSGSSKYHAKYLMCIFTWFAFFVEFGATSPITNWGLTHFAEN